MTTNNPFEQIDLSALVQQMNIPGVDQASIDSLTEAHQKNIQAIVDANKAAAEGYQTLAQRQIELFQQTLQDMGTPKPMGDDPAANLSSAVETGLNNMRELFDMATKANQQAFDIISERAQENMQSLNDLTNKK